MPPQQVFPRSKYWSDQAGEEEGALEADDAWAEEVLLEGIPLEGHEVADL
jgi:hypothetical protein